MLRRQLKGLCMYSLTFSWSFIVPEILSCLVGIITLRDVLAFCRVLLDKS